MDVSHRPECGVGSREEGSWDSVFEHRLQNQADPKLLGVSLRWCGSQG